MSRTILRLGYMSLVALQLGTAASASTWNMASDFVQTLGQNGPWSYGYSQDTGAGADTMLPYTTLTSDSGLVGMGLGPAFFQDPNIFKNISGTPQNPLGGIEYQIGQLATHPSGWETINYIGNAMVRFTAPATGTYQYLATFTPIDQFVGNGPGIHAMVNINGTQVYSGTDSVYQSTLSATNTVSLTAGAYVDFLVGSAGAQVTSESTGIDALIVGPNVPISPNTPEPSSFISTLIGFVSFGAWRVYRRRIY
jgi:hypothetical protein